MLRLPVFYLVPALLAALPLAAQTPSPVDSVVRTTTVTTVTTTTVTKPAAPGSKPAAPVTSSSSTTTTTTEPATPATPAARPAASGGDLTGARPRATTTTTTTVPAATAAPKPAAPKPATVTKPAAATAAKPKTTTTPAAARTTATATAARRTSADPELVHFLQTDVDLTLVRAEQLPNLYERFMETTRAERRQWTAAQWASASAVLARLNQRYEQVRGELSLEEKLNIRTLQGEFRGLEAAKQVSKRL